MTAPKVERRVFSGMLSGDTCVSIPDFLLLCLVIELVTVHTCELIKSFFVSPYGMGQAIGRVTYKLKLLLLCEDSLTQFFVFV